MRMIAAVDNNWAIGNNNSLLANVPEDMKFFRNTTKGNVIVMGRKTLESFPGQRALPDRVNIVLTRNSKYTCKGAIVVHSEEELFKQLEQYESDHVYIIGGESIYRQYEPYCDLAYITKIDFAYQADAYFPNLDELPAWTMIGTSEENTCFDIEYYFTTYQNQAPKKMHI